MNQPIAPQVGDADLAPSQAETGASTSEAIALTAVNAAEKAKEFAKIALERVQNSSTKERVVAGAAVLGVAAAGAAAAYSASKAKPKSRARAKKA